MFQTNVQQQKVNFRRNVSFLGKIKMRRILKDPLSTFLLFDFIRLKLKFLIISTFEMVYPETVGYGTIRVTNSDALQYYIIKN